MDERIEICRKEMDTLESYIKLIYERWFVQYDFPDENGNPYKSSGGKMIWSDILQKEIPEQWTVDCIEAFLKRTEGSIKLPTAEYREEGPYPIIDQSEKFIVGYSDNKDAVVNYPFCIVFGDHSCTVKAVNFPFIRGADGTQIIRSNTPHIHEIQIYFWLKSIKFDGEYKRHFPWVKQLPFVCCNNLKIADDFRIITNVVWKQILSQQQIIQKLIRIRDWLLPMLMNGQITVK